MTSQPTLFDDAPPVVPATVRQSWSWMLSIVRMYPGRTISEHDQFFREVLGGMPGRYSAAEYAERLVVLLERGAVMVDERGAWWPEGGGR